MGLAPRRVLREHVSWTLMPGEITAHLGLRITTPARTIADRVTWRQLVDEPGQVIAVIAAALAAAA